MLHSVHCGASGLGFLEQMSKFAPKCGSREAPKDALVLELQRLLILEIGISLLSFFLIWLALVFQVALDLKSS